MKMQNGNVVFEVTNPIQIRAFKNSGYSEVKKAKPNNKDSDNNAGTKQ